MREEGGERERRRGRGIRGREGRRGWTGIREEVWTIQVDPETEPGE